MTLSYLTQRTADVPGDTDWLSPRERETLDSFRFPKRRDDWLLGRWTAKCALVAMPGVRDSAPWHREILAEPDGAPAVWLHGVKQPLAISLSHREGCGLCVVAEPGTELGCDLELVETRSNSFEETFFTADELRWLEGRCENERARAVTLLWSAKESALKALRLGLKADTRRIEVKPVAKERNSTWGRFEAIDQDLGMAYSGWWRTLDSLLLSVASRPHTGDAPVRLRRSSP